jgi:predicted DNA-binding transcriptional regulator YafY
MAKADNLLAALWLLRSRPRTTAAQIAEALEISIRTAYRYIDALSASGVPVIADAGPEGGYRLPEHFRGAPLFFDATELAALHQAALFASQAGYPHSNALQTALAKVRHNLAPDQRAELERHTQALAVRHHPRGGEVEPWLGDLERSVAERATVELIYQKLDADEPERRLVDPYGLSYSNGLWFLTGFCHLRQDRRSFRVDRIRALELTGATFERPADFQQEEPQDDRWIQERLDQGPLLELRITGAPSAIAAVWDHWYLRRCRVRQTAREAVFAVDPAGLAELPGYLLTFGTNLTVLEPASLCSAMDELARRLAEHHASASRKAGMNV